MKISSIVKLNFLSEKRPSTRCVNRFEISDEEYESITKYVDEFAASIIKNMTCKNAAKKVLQDYPTPKDYPPRLIFQDYPSACLCEEIEILNEPYAEIFEELFIKKYGKQIESIHGEFMESDGVKMEIKKDPRGGYVCR